MLSYTKGSIRMLKKFKTQWDSIDDNVGQSG